MRKNLANVPLQAPPPPPPLPASGASKLQLCPMISRETFLCRRCVDHEGTSQMDAIEVCKQMFDASTLLSKNNVLISYYSRVLPVLQDGPSCGLAALCMAGQLVNTNGPPKFLSLSDVIEAAQERQYTFRGEMFSASDMSTFVKEVLCCTVELLQDGLKQRTKIIQHLIRGLPILVPYDADSNHHPCCRQGHKAHWAVVTGIVLVADANSDLPWNAFTRDNSWPVLFHADSNNGSFADHCSNSKVLEVLNSVNGVYVYAKQGKSCRVLLWNYDDLASSNANLFEFCPLRKESAEKYILPAEGVQGGLCEKLLLIGGN